jgi:hypothetical protein
MGIDARRILTQAAPFLPGNWPVPSNGLNLKSEVSLDVGPFKITPFLIDHSGYDAYSLLIEANGKRLFYSGDFRAHGRKASLTNVFLDILHSPSVKLPSEDDLAIPDPEAQLVAALHAIPDWTVPYLDYLSRGVLPDDALTARLIVRRSKSMSIVNGELHMRSITGVFQRCVSPGEGR